MESRVQLIFFNDRKKSRKKKLGKQFLSSCRCYRLWHITGKYVFLSFSWLTDWLTRLLGSSTPTRPLCPLGRGRWLCNLIMIWQKNLVALALLTHVFTPSEFFFPSISYLVIQDNNNMNSVRQVEDRGDV